MPLDANALERIGGGANGLFVYLANTDAIAAVTASGYFNPLTNRLRRGDVIIVVSNNFAAVDVICVTSATGAATVTTTAVEGSTGT
jgi:uncharacterized phosphosugar-binding protein